MRVVYAERAVHDIDEIYGAIAERSTAAAQRVEEFIRTTCIGLADFPFASAATDEPSARRVPRVRFPSTIFFRIDQQRDLVEIARVLHSARVKTLRSLPDYG